MRGAKPRTTTILLALLTCTFAAPLSGDQKEPPAEGKVEATEQFHFLGPHLFPFEKGIGGLIPHDMNGDGRTDLILVDMRASKFQMLLQKDEGVDEEEKPAEWPEGEPNELQPDRLLAKDEVQINETLLGYVVGGFAGDRAAITYFTDGKELVVQRRDEAGNYETAQRFLLDLESNFCGGFECEDLDGNGTEDLVFLGQDTLLILLQDKGGKLAEPRRHPIAKEKSVGLVLGDANNDGRPDILYRSPGTRYPLRIRLTQPDGSPGPEYRFRMPSPRDVAVGNCAGDDRNEIAVIESTTNRVKLLRWELQEKAPMEGTEAGALELVPFPKDQKAKLRSFAIADVDGNGLPDVVLTEPDAARMTLVRSQKGTGLLPVESFPSLEEATSLTAFIAPDGSTELALCSKKEGMLGISRYDAKSGRLEYPRPVDVGGEPSAVAVAQSAGAGPHLYCSVRGAEEEQQGKGGAGKKGPVELVTVGRGETGYQVVRRQVLEGLKEPPAQLLAVDADGNGLADLLAFPEYEPPLLLIQDDAGSFAVVSERPGFHKHMLRNLKPAAVAAAGPRAGGGPGLFLGNRNLVRAVRYDGSNLVVEDQYSSTNARTSYAALAAADLDGDTETDILAADYTSKWLAVLQRNEKGVYEVTRNIEIGPFEFLGLTTADVDGDGAAEVLIVGQDKLGVLFLTEGGPELKEIATIETDQKETAYAQVVIDDLNADGKNDLLLREIQKHQLEVFYLRPDGEWKTGMRFKVFEGRTFARREQAAPEPREAVTGELTGDGLTDVAIIVHDRVIVYPQQGPSTQD